jgi:hypothetical protein
MGGRKKALPGKVQSPRSRCLSTEELFVSQKTKKKRQQRAQSRLALARFRQQQREQRQRTAAHRAEKQWNKTLRHLAELGAPVQEHEGSDGNGKVVYTVTFEGKIHRFGSRFHLQRWLKRERARAAEEQMSWAERHVQWMIDNNCDDHGNPWPE